MLRLDLVIGFSKHWSVTQEHQVSLIASMAQCCRLNAKQVSGINMASGAVYCAVVVLIRKICFQRLRHVKS